MRDLEGEDFDRLLDSMPGASRKVVLESLSDETNTEPTSGWSLATKFLLLYFSLLLVILWALAGIVRHLATLVEQITKECLDKLRRDFLD